MNYDELYENGWCTPVTESADWDVAIKAFYNKSWTCWKIDGDLAGFLFYRLEQAQELSSFVVRFGDISFDNPKKGKIIVYAEIIATDIPHYEENQ